jgi:hypothetical protein
LYQLPLRPAPKAFANGDIYACKYFAPSAGALLRKLASLNCEKETDENRIRIIIRIPDLLTV